MKLTAADLNKKYVFRSVTPFNFLNMDKNTIFKKILSH